LRALPVAVLAVALVGCVGGGGETAGGGQVPLTGDATQPDIKVNYGDGGGMDAGGSSSGGDSSGGTSSGGDDAGRSSSGGTSSGGDDAGRSSSGASSGGADAGRSSSGGGDASSGGADGGGTPGSCAGICGKYVGGASCQCDGGCSQYGDCCKDYQALCGCKVDKDCDDKSVCTKDSCDKGSCKHPKIDCEDGNTCTQDLCVKDKGCQSAPMSSGACDDGDVCTVGDACASGACVGTKKSCDDNNPCTNDVCMAAGCTNPPVNDGMPCGAGSACVSGQCTAQGDCTQGMCCDAAAKKFKPAGTACSPGVAATEYKCAGQDLQQRVANAGCTGASATTCSADKAHLVWKPWVSAKTCGAGTKCNADTQSCDPDNSGQCSSGVCCDVGAKAFKAKNTKCGAAAIATETRCSGTKTLQQRQSFGGCSGGSPTCSTAASDLHWTTWATIKTCAASETCTATSGTTAICKPGQVEKADLTPILLKATGSTTVAAGKTIQIEYTRKNQGNADSGKFHDAYVLSPNTTLSNADKLLKSSERAAMKAGETKGPYKLTLTIPAGTKAGNWYLGYWIDHKSAVAESNEANNKKTLLIKVTNTAQCTSGVCCNTTTKQWQPKGTKCGATIKKTEYRCSGTKTVQRRRAYQGCTGTSATFCSTLTTNYHWTTWATSQTCSSTQTCTTTSATYAYCKTTTAKADLAATALKATSSTTVQAGKTISIEYTRKNLGNKASGAFHDGYLLSTNSVISGNDTLLKSLARTSMAAGETKGPYKLTLTIPASTKAGTWYLGYHVDHKYAVSETTESNNKRTIKLTITAAATAKPDLQPTYFAVDGSLTVYRGKTVKLRYTRKNAGTASSGAFYDGYFLSTNNIISPSDTLLSSVKRTSMTPGQSAGPFTRTVTIPAGAKTGTMYLGYYVDYKKEVAEGLEANNYKYVKVTVK